ncbi:asparaginase [Georgenia satyanarayanai]|uniref:asparaginase n=1 Tax=Georgenia satyanarayanai TaxID=860221 RepID=UPI001264CE52|nr:asparaginase [Georgenia satyanarayanai]
MPELAAVRRGGFTESRHVGTVVVLGRDGEDLLVLGDGGTAILPRSTVKPVQALACLTAGAPLAGEELAIAAGSHTGEDRHVAVVRRLLERAGLSEEHLGCPVDWPEHEATRERLLAAGAGRTRVRMNCSGKHAAMLLACVTNGWSVEGYLDADHPLQRHVARTLEELSGEPLAHVTVDGCGAPLFGLSVRGLARAFHRLATSPAGSPEAQVAEAMRTHPFFVGGEPHSNSDAMRLVPGLLAKGGAEGVIGMAAPTGEAVALKVDDGNPRATTLVALHALESVGVDVSGAAELRDLPVLGGGERVGEIVVGADLQRATR